MVRNGSLHLNPVWSNQLGTARHHDQLDSWTMHQFVLICGKRSVCAPMIIYYILYIIYPSGVARIGRFMRPRLYIIYDLCNFKLKYAIRY